MQDEFFKKAFDIGDIPENIDFDIPPVTGFEYLYRVRLEAMSCPKVVVSDMDTTKYTSNQTIAVDACNGFIRAKPGFEPGSVWLEKQLHQFTSYRDHLERNREELKIKFPKQNVPKINKAQEWCLFCLGSDACNQLYSRDPSSSKTQVEQNGTGPLLSVVLHLNQNRVIKLLSYHIEWMQELGFTHNAGRWVYALLACLEIPLDPDTCSLIRTLSRVCSKLRDQLLDTENEFLDPLNLILVLVSHYFDQKDMSDSYGVQL